jgi:hypothetical protein
VKQDEEIEQFGNEIPKKAWGGGGGGAGARYHTRKLERKNLEEGEKSSGDARRSKQR